MDSDCYWVRGFFFFFFLSEKVLEVDTGESAQPCEILKTNRSLEIELYVMSII